MNMQDMVPNMNLREYVPPTTQPEHLLDPLMRNLNEQVSRHQQSTSAMMQTLGGQMASIQEARKSATFAPMDLQ